MTYQGNISIITLASCQYTSSFDTQQSTSLHLNHILVPRYQYPWSHLLSYLYHLESVGDTQHSAHNALDAAGEATCVTAVIHTSSTLHHWGIVLLFITSIFNAHDIGCHIYCTKLSYANLSAWASSMCTAARDDLATSDVGSSGQFLNSQLDFYWITTDIFLLYQLYGPKWWMQFLTILQDFQDT
jgi:hypothetical protein